jgi:aminoglycoside phosphotransferase (APT) family kinase protein
MSETNIGTMPVQAKHQIDGAALEKYLRAHVTNFSGPLTIEQFKGGQSNPTFKLITPTKNYVLRAKPGPAAKLLPSAHAVDREYRVLTALHGSDVPVAKTYALCEDENIIGRAFYVMDCVEGRVLWDPTLPGFSNSERRAVYEEMNRVIAALHKIDYAKIGLADYGKPGNYFARQIARWSKQYKASETEKIDAMDKLIEWLPQNIPTDEESSIVHGDYRLDNMIFHPTEPKILAILDWELSTLGHPLADFSYHCMTWNLSTSEFRGMAGVDLQSLGIPTQEEYVTMYCQRTGRSKIDNWDFYMAYNMFRLAGILQGIMGRVVDGTASSLQAIESGKRARPMAEAGWRQVEKILSQ